FDLPSELVNSTVDRAPSTRRLNFILTATSGPSTVACVAGVDWSNTACARATRGISTSATAMATITPDRTTSRPRELRKYVSIGLRFISTSKRFKSNRNFGFAEEPDRYLRTFAQHRRPGLPHPKLSFHLS